MRCKVEDCCVEAMYKSAQLCQKHYFRQMRNGSTELKRKRNYRSRNAKGYQLVYEPSHPLAHKNGYVYEHRFVYFEQVNPCPEKCEMCGVGISWDDLHIDHKDNDITNNKKDNLRATCRACNTFRGHDCASMTKSPIELYGVRMSAESWSRVDGVRVSGKTITNRIKNGWSFEKAIFGEKSTHRNSLPKKDKKRTDLEKS